MKNPYQYLYNIDEIEDEILKLDGMFYRLDEKDTRLLHANIILLENYLNTRAKEIRKEIKHNK